MRNFAFYTEDGKQADAFDNRALQGTTLFFRIQFNYTTLLVLCSIMTAQPLLLSAPHLSSVMRNVNFSQIHRTASMRIFSDRIPYFSAHSKNAVLD